MSIIKYKLYLYVCHFTYVFVTTNFSQYVWLWMSRGGVYWQSQRGGSNSAKYKIPLWKMTIDTQLTKICFVLESLISCSTDFILNFLYKLIYSSFFFSKEVATDYKFLHVYFVSLQLWMMVAMVLSQFIISMSTSLVEDKCDGHQARLGLRPWSMMGCPPG